VAIPPDDPIWDIDGDGDCVVTNKPDATGTLEGSLNGAAAGTAGCAAGVLMGSLTFTTDAPGMGQADSNAAVALHNGPMLSVAMNEGTVFAGAGTFVDIDAGVTACSVTASSITLNFRGVFVFEDPVLD